MIDLSNFKMKLRMRFSASRRQKNMCDVLENGQVSQLGADRNVHMDHSPAMQKNINPPSFPSAKPF